MDSGFLYDGMFGADDANDPLSLSPAQRQRYGRQINLEQVGESGQLLLKAARVLIVGLGGLGSPVALYLAAAGVGTLGLCDADMVDISNLQRQVLYKSSDVGRSKTLSAAFTLAQSNPDVRTESINCFMDKQNAFEIVQNFDVVVDCTDSLTARYALSDACVAAKVPMVYGALHKFEGQVSVFCQPGMPCYRCYFAESDEPAPPTCADVGVLGVLPGIVGTMQAAEVLKLILDVGETLSGRVLFFDALKMQSRTMQLAVDKSCLCQDGEAMQIVGGAGSAVRGARQTDKTDADTNDASATDTRTKDGAPHASTSAELPRLAIDSAALMQKLQEDQRLQEDQKLHEDQKLQDSHIDPANRTKSVLLVDVRRPDEYRAMRFADCIHVPLEIFSGSIGPHLETILAAPLVVFYCRSGVRSKAAIDSLHQVLASRGEDLDKIPPICNLTGGILQWYRQYQDQYLASDARL